MGGLIHPAFLPCWILVAAYNHLRVLLQVNIGVENRAKVMVLPSSCKEDKQIYSLGCPVNSSGRTPFWLQTDEQIQFHKDEGRSNGDKDDDGG